MKINENKWVRIILFVFGLGLCSFPLISEILQWNYQSQAISTYDKLSEELDQTQIQDELNKAYQYNTILYELDPMRSGRFDQALSDDAYNETLDMYGTGVIGSVEIPSIDIHLPIYHGTDDSVLNSAVGHVQYSSFPVGGINTRTILTGHRGSPSAKLFTRLDELGNGDLFYIHVLGETLAYKVYDITVIEPESLDSLSFVEGKDLATLFTCTPYGINSHRLVITGERTEYIQEEYDSIERSSLSLRETIFILIPIIFVIFGVSACFKYFCKRKKGGNNARR